jgi:hypothetical protein
MGILRNDVRGLECLGESYPHHHHRYRKNVSMKNADDDEHLRRDCCCCYWNCGGELDPVSLSLNRHENCSWVSPKRLTCSHCGLIRTDRSHSMSESTLRRNKRKEVRG